MAGTLRMSCCNDSNNSKRTMTPPEITEAARDCADRVIALCNSAATLGADKVVSRAFETVQLAITAATEAKDREIAGLQKVLNTQADMMFNQAEQIAQLRQQVEEAKRIYETAQSNAVLWKEEQEKATAHSRKQSDIILSTEAACRVKDAALRKFKDVVEDMKQHNFPLYDASDLCLTEITEAIQTTPSTALQPIVEALKIALEYSSEDGYQMSHTAERHLKHAITLLREKQTFPASGPQGQAVDRP